MLKPKLLGVAKTEFLVKKEIDFLLQNSKIVEHCDGLKRKTKREKIMEGLNTSCYSEPWTEEVQKDLEKIKKKTQEIFNKSSSIFNLEEFRFPEEIVSTEEHLLMVC